MKKFFLGLLFLACTGTAWAQTPTSTLPVAEPTAVVLAVQPGTAPSSVHIQQVSGCFGASPCAKACCPTTCCAPKCCEPAFKTICIPTASTVVTKKISYSSTCEKVCVPKCSSFFGGCKTGCDTGCEAKCDSQIYQKRYLVKHVCVTVCPTTKCVPVTVPACETARCGIATAAPVVVETVPVQPKKK
jgi:hypothetical protein